MSESVLTIEHLTKQFDNSTVLNDLSLQIHEGEAVVIVGPSGCGKSEKFSTAVIWWTETTGCDCPCIMYAP